MSRDECYVTGRTTSKDAVTVSVPTESGKIIISISESEICDICDKPLLTASASIDGNNVDMSPDGNSINALVPLKVVNVKDFTLPQTGSASMWIYTSVGILVMAGVATLIVLLCVAIPRSAAAGESARMRPVSYSSRFSSSNIRS